MHCFFEFVTLPITATELGSIVSSKTYHASCELSRFEKALGTASKIFCMGNLCPMTPVEHTRELFGTGLGCSRSSAATMLDASSRPPSPVTALAQPELMIMDLMSFPFRRSRTRLLTVTGAAWKMFWVKTAAAEHDLSDEITARSGRFVLDALMPTWVPETENPLGYVPEVGTYFSFASGIEPSTGAEYCRTICLIAVIAAVFGYKATNHDRSAEIHAIQEGWFTDKFAMQPLSWLKPPKKLWKIGTHDIASMRKITISSTRMQLFYTAVRA